MKSVCFLLFFALVSHIHAAEKPASVRRVQNYVAVFDLEVTGKMDKDVARPLSDSVRREIIRSGKYEVIDRSNMDRILKEQAFQMAACTQKECAVEAGQLLGAGKIVMGTLSVVGQTYYLSLSLINVETGKTEAVEEDTCKCEIDELIQSSKRAANKLVGGTYVQTPTVDTREPAIVKEKSPTTAGLLSILPGGGMYYVGSFGDRGASSWITARGYLYTTAGIVGGFASWEVLAGSIVFGAIDSILSARSYNEHFAHRLKLGFDYDPHARASLVMLNYSF